MLIITIINARVPSLCNRADVFVELVLLRVSSARTYDGRRALLSREYRRRDEERIESSRFRIVLSPVYFASSVTHFGPRSRRSHNCYEYYRRRHRGHCRYDLITSQPPRRVRVVYGHATVLTRF